MTGGIRDGFISDQQNLWGFVLHAKFFRNGIGDGPVPDQIQEMKIGICRRDRFFQPVFCHGTYGTAGAMFEDHLWLCLGSLSDFFQVAHGRERNPIHGWR
jgi:hypothetical protein